MLCDLTIAADNATFGEPEVRFSSVGPAIVMPMIIGYKRARELLYFGDTIDAKSALELRMVNRVVPRAELRAASLRYAKRLSLISPKPSTRPNVRSIAAPTPRVSARRFMPGSTFLCRARRCRPALRDQDGIRDQVP
jgi:enoyl-CoA hydratase